MKLVFKALVLVGIVYLLLRAMIWWHVNETVSQVNQISDRSASFEHQGFDSELFGPIGVHKAKLVFADNDDEIIIDHLYIPFNDLTSRYALLKNWITGHKSLNFSLKAESVSIPVNSSALKQTKQLIQQTNHLLWPIINCGNKPLLASNNIELMGYEKIQGDIDFNYSYDNQNSLYEFVLSNKLDKMGAVHLSGKFSTASSISNLVDSWDSLMIHQLQLDNRLHSWHQRSTNHCAMQGNINVDDYLDRTALDFGQRLDDLDLNYNVSLLSKYREFKRGSANAGWSINPKDPIRIKHMFKNPNLATLEQLGVTLFLNGERHQLYGEPPKMVESEKKRTLKQAVIISNKKLQTSPVIASNLVKLANLGQHLNKSLQIVTNKGKRHHGLVVSVDDRSIKLTKLLVGGSATYKIKKSTIKTIILDRARADTVDDIRN